MVQCYTYLDIRWMFVYELRITSWLPVMNLNQQPSVNPPGICVSQPVLTPNRSPGSTDGPDNMADTYMSDNRGTMGQLYSTLCPGITQNLCLRPFVLKHLPADILCKWTSSDDHSGTPVLSSVPQEGYLDHYQNDLDLDYGDIDDELEDDVFADEDEEVGIVPGFTPYKDRLFSFRNQEVTAVVSDHEWSSDWESGESVAGHTDQLDLVSRPRNGKMYLSVCRHRLPNLKLLHILTVTVLMKGLV